MYICLSDGEFRKSCILDGKRERERKRYEATLGGRVAWGCMSCDVVM